MTDLQLFAFTALLGPDRCAGCCDAVVLCVVRKREMTDEEAMGRWFSKATKPQLAKYNERMVVAAAYRGSPRWDRIRTDAQKEFHETTSDARALYELAMSDLLSLGEVSEETDYALTQFQITQIVQQAAE